jgi:hypothetical protein
MPYEVMATQKTPALIIYLIDSSQSMSETLDGVPKISHVHNALQRVISRMVRRSTKGELVSPRYRIAMITYSTDTDDILKGIKTIDEIAMMGVPDIQPSNRTDTAKAFALARDILARELPSLRGHPAPMVCHLTDGAFTGPDPEPIAREIMGMANDDGNVLIENIYVGGGLTHQPIADAQSWSGITSVNELANDHAKKLYSFSSQLPASYSQMIREDEYALNAGARMLFPAGNEELIELAFAMSGATPTT